LAAASFAPDKFAGWLKVISILTAFYVGVQNTATRFARLVDAIKASIWRKASGVSTISNSSGGFSGNDGSTTGTRGSRDTAADLADDDGLDPDPLDDLAASTKKREADSVAAANTSGTAVGH